MKTVRRRREMEKREINLSGHWWVSEELWDLPTEFSKMKSSGWPWEMWFHWWVQKPKYTGLGENELKKWMQWFWTFLWNLIYRGTVKWGDNWKEVQGRDFLFLKDGQNYSIFIIGKTSRRKIFDARKEITC